MLLNLEILKGKNDVSYKAQKAVSAVAEIADNTITAKVASYGTIDRYGDVTAPGFFKTLIKDFLLNGFITMGHNWSEPVGMPTDATDKADGLYGTAEFHSTEDGQNARTIASERAEKGLTTGASVSFTCEPGGYAYFSSGDEMLTFMKSSNVDLSGYDVKSIKAWKRSCRWLVKGGKLFEWCIALVPVNTDTAILAVKSFSSNGAHGASLEERLDVALGAISGVTDDLIAIKALRDAKGTAISPARLEEARQILKALGAFLADAERGDNAGLPEVQMQSEDKAARDKRRLDIARKAAMLKAEQIKHGIEVMQ